MTLISNRRRRWSALALLIAGGVLLAGCGSSSSDGGSSDLVITTPEASGDIDSFTWNLPYGEPTSLDPIYAFNFSENTVLANVCDALLRETPDGTIEPSLAEKVDHPTPNEWVYAIRQGVKFFDGATLTADDVVYNLNRNLDPALASFYGLPWGAGIASVKKTGANEVTVTTKDPNTLINEMMVTGLGTIAQAKAIKEQGKAFGTPDGDLQCTGAFQLDGWKPGSSLTLKRNPGYWDKDLQPKAAEVNFKFITDQTALANALKSGEIDGTYEAPIATVKQGSDSSGTVYIGQSTQGLTLLPTTSGPSVKLREALSAAIDRDGIAETAYAGTASGLKAFGSPDASNYGKDIFENAYDSVPSPGPDIEHAKKLVDEAGGAGSPINMAVQAGDPAIAQTASAIQDAAKQAGMQVEIKTLPPAQFSALYFDPSARAGYDVLLASTYSDVHDVLQLYFIGFTTGSLLNLVDYSNPTVDSKTAEAVATEDETKRANAAVEAGAPITDQLPGIPLLRLHQRLFLGSDITGAPAGFPYQYYPWAALVGAND